METVLYIIQSIFHHIIVIVIFVIFYFAVTLPFAYFKYLFDKEKSFLTTWVEYTIAFEKFWDIFRKLFVAIIFFFLFYFTL